VPKATNFFIKICPEKHVNMKITKGTKAKILGSTRTSLEELVDRWVSRAAPAFVDFFKRLEPRVETTFLTGAFEDLTTGAVSCKEGSSAAIASIEGIVEASFFGFSLSLRRKGKGKDFM
jgi:hypothetical protein